MQPEDLLLHGLVQARAEGADVDDLERRWQDAGGGLEVPVSGAAETPAPPALRALATELLDVIDERTPACHLDPTAAVARARGAATALPSAGPTDELADRLHGAWLGRAAGCLLGKPVEKIPRRGIEAILRDTGRWPLDDWFTARGLSDEVARAWPWNRRSAPTSLAENIDGMPEDDDLNFAVLALRLLQQARRDGRALQTDDVAKAWLDNLPAGRVFTAERVAYRNLLEGVKPDRAALVRNPFREWIGALIRADVHGWAHPGDLAAAVASAAVDARLSHTGAGAEGELWAAALASAALVVDDVAEAVRTARLVLDPDGPLARAVDLGSEVGASDLDDAQALDRLHETYGHHHWVHVLPNAATIAFALVRGRGDLGRTAALAVTAGWDTDSVGATVGGVVGAVVGAEALPERWVTPLHDRLATSLPGPNDLSLHYLAAQTLGLATRGRDDAGEADERVADVEGAGRARAGVGA
ncbi:ADP-ribosylglycohydrolase [Terracoccus luteus]|uniref:ADP-ribosylglycohydrolase n=1 Tax=Terracoccus luteus TaxID=53356 RepID=A0A495XV82_9MICO|nr:ADP-ribosylglycohydrolase family protein [Terracoccus luteus]RKT76716.1 ADP-ribosylglycohydrolase [Terracoccus luteus]